METGRRRRRYHFKTRFWVISSVLLLTVVLGCVFLLRSCMSQAPQPEDALQDDNAGTTLKAGADAGKSYTDAILFIGDSRTEGLVTYGFLPQTQVLAKDGLNHQSARTKAFLPGADGNDKTIAQMVKEKQPVYMLISFGINGMSYFGETLFMSEYEGLVDDLLAQSPDSIIILQSIYPVSAQQALLDPGMANDVIDGYNKKLEELAKKRGWYYLNTVEKLKNASGALDERYDAGDGLHVNKAAYDVIIAYVSTHPAPLK